MRDEAPGSLVDVRRIVSLAVAFGGAFAILQIALLAQSNWWVPIGILLPPVIGWAFIASALASGRRLRALAITAVTLAAHALVGLVTLGCVGVISEEGILVGGILEIATFIFVAIVIAPVTLAAAVVRREQDLDAGDALLGYCGGWFALLETALLLAFKSDFDHLAATASLLMVAGIVGGVAALGVCIARGIVRRRWCARVMRGEVAGWRVRRRTTYDAIEDLPCVFKSSDGVKAVLERVEMGGALYRSGLVGQPVATMRVLPEHELHALNDA